MRNIYAMGALAMMAGMLAAAPPDPRGIRFEMLPNDDLLPPPVAPQRRRPSVAARRREDASATIAAAEAKRHRKAAKRLALTKASSP